jgi:DNA-binding XRE family transcriptional regulator
MVIDKDFVVYGDYDYSKLPAAGNGFSELNEVKRNNFYGGNEVDNDKVQKFVDRFRRAGFGNDWARLHFDVNKKYKMRNNLKNILKEKGMLQNKLAELVGIDKSTMSDIMNERGNQSIITITKICYVLGISFDNNFWLEEASPYEE